MPTNKIAENERPPSETSQERDFLGDGWRRFVYVARLGLWLLRATCLSHNGLRLYLVLTWLSSVAKGKRKEQSNGKQEQSNGKQEQSKEQKGVEEEVSGATFYAALDTLKKYTGLSEPTIRSALKHLIDLGLVEQAKDGNKRRRRAAEYRLCRPDRWHAEIGRLRDESPKEQKRFVPTIPLPVLSARWLTGSELRVFLAHWLHRYLTRTSWSGYRLSSKECSELTGMKPSAVRRATKGLVAKDLVEIEVGGGFYSNRYRVADVPVEIEEESTHLVRKVPAGSNKAPKLKGGKRDRKLRDWKYYGRPSSGELEKKNPRDRWELQTYRELPVEEWGGMELLGYWAEQFHAHEGRDDYALYVTLGNKLDEKAVRLWDYVAEDLDGDPQRGKVLIDNVFRRKWWDLDLSFNVLFPKSGKRELIGSVFVPVNVTPCNCLPTGTARVADSKRDWRQPADVGDLVTPHAAAVPPTRRAAKNPIREILETKPNDRITFECPACGEIADVDDEICPHCGVVFPPLPDDQDQSRAAAAG